MQIRRLRLVNFRQHADTTLEFDAGMTGIIGPNGAGKSTLLEAIAWAMYGIQAARGNRDSIRRRNAPPRSRVEVELDFLIGAHRYRVSRTLQGASLLQDGEIAPIANSGPAVTDKVTRLLGMSREEFFNTYFTGQKELAVMASMTAPERARFLSRVLGYERLATVQVQLKEERAAIRAALQTAEIGLPDAAELAEEERQAGHRVEQGEAAVQSAGRNRLAVDEALRQIGPQWEEMQRRREAVLTIETDLNIADHAAVEAKRSFQSLDLELTESLEAKAKRDELAPQVAPWEELSAEKLRLDAENMAFAGRRGFEAQLAEVTKAIAALDLRIADLPDQARVAAARAELVVAQELTHRATHGFEEQRTAWVREKQDAETSRKQLLQQHEDVKDEKERLEKAGSSGICPTCGKPLGAEFQTVLEDLEDRMVEIMSNGRHYRARIEQLGKEPETVTVARKTLEGAEVEGKRLIGVVGRLEQGLAERARAETARAEAAERIAALEKTLADTPTKYDESLHRGIQERLKLLAPIRDQVLRLTARAERAAELVPKAAEAEQNLTKLEVRAATLRTQLVTLGWSADAYEAMRLRVQVVERDRQAAEVTLVRAQSERAAAIEHRGAVARRREERDRRVAEVERLRSEQLFNQELDRAFSDLRDDLNSTIRPELADQAASLLSDLTDGRYTDLELNEDYEASVIDDGEPKTVISGGEEDVVNLSLRLAISQMIADRAGQPFSLLILDEVFGSLDEERRASVVELLRGLADRFPQVILITHIESVRDGFDRIIRIDYDVERGVATAREDRHDGTEAPDVAA